jgi:hypothetical protein
LCSKAHLLTGYSLGEVRGNSVVDVSMRRS